VKACQKTKARKEQRDSFFSLEQLRREFSYMERKWQADGKAKEG